MPLKNQCERCDNHADESPLMKYGAYTVCKKCYTEYGVAVLEHQQRTELAHNRFEIEFFREASRVNPCIMTAYKCEPAF